MQALNQLSLTICDEGHIEFMNISFDSWSIDDEKYQNIPWQRYNTNIRIPSYIFVEVSVYVYEIKIEINRLIYIYQYL